MLCTIRWSDNPILETALGNSAAWKIETVIPWKRIVDLYCKQNGNFEISIVYVLVGISGIDRDAILTGFTASETGPGDSIETTTEG